MYEHAKKQYGILMSVDNDEKRNAEKILDDIGLSILNRGMDHLRIGNNGGISKSSVAFLFGE